MSASQILKDTFYRDKLLSLSSTEQTLNLEKKKLKELGKKPLTAEQIANGLSHLGKLATGTGYGYLVLQLINLNLFSIEVNLIFISFIE